MQLIRPIQTRSRFGSEPLVLNLAAYHNSPDHSTIGTWSPIDGLSVLVSTGFQVLFHSPPGVLFTFPSQYYALSVTEESLGLEGGPSGFPQGFSCLVVLWILLGFGQISSTGFSPSLMRLSRRFDYPSSCHDAVRNPKMQALWFGLFPFRSPLLRKSMFLSPPEGT